MDIVNLKAEDRTETGKSGAKRLRSQGKLPVNLYGYKTDTSSLVVEAHEFERIMRTHAGSNFIMKLEIDGRDDSSVIVKEIQRHPVKGKMIHVDLLSVALDEKIVTGVPLRVVGESIGVKEGGVLQHGVRELQVEVLPTALPEYLEVDISELGTGGTMHASEVSLPDGVSLMSSPEEVVVNILAPTKLVEPELEAVEEELEEVPEGEEEAAAEEQPSEEEAKES